MKNHFPGLYVPGKGRLLLRPDGVLAGDNDSGICRGGRNSVTGDCHPGVQTETVRSVHW